MVGTTSERSEEIVASTRPSGGGLGGAQPLPVRKAASIVATDEAPILLGKAPILFTHYFPQKLIFRARTQLPGTFSLNRIK